MGGKSDGEPLPETPYTPGPWRAREYKTADGGIWIDCEAWARRRQDGLLVRSTMGSARTVGGTVATAMGTGTGEEWTVEANAKLIATAPELAEMLLALVEYHGCFAPGKAFRFPEDHMIFKAREILLRVGLSPSMPPEGSPEIVP